MLRADSEIGGDDPHDVATRKLRTAVLAAFGDHSEDAERGGAPHRRHGGRRVGRGDARRHRGHTSIGEELRWAVRRYFEQRVAAWTVALIFDDIQWAEDPMLEMIEHLGEWSRAPLFVLCLARPELRDRGRAGAAG